MLTLGSALLGGCSRGAAPTATPRVEPDAGAAGAGERGLVQVAGEAPRVRLGGVALPEGVSLEQIELGRLVYMGEVGAGGCHACHKMSATGGTLAPDQTDDEWIHIDGSYDSILEISRKGVPTPRFASVPMAPRGGTNLSDEHLEAVAAYIWALSRAGAD